VGFSAEFHTNFCDFEDVSGADSLALGGVVQVAAGSARCEISTEIEFTGPSAAEWAYEPRSPRVATTESWALAEVGAGGPLKDDAQPFALRKAELKGIPVGPERGEGGITEVGRDGFGLFSEQAEAKQFIDIDDAVGQPEFFDQDAFAFCFTPGSHLWPVMSYIECPSEQSTHYVRCRAAVFLGFCIQFGDKPGWHSD